MDFRLVDSPLPSSSGGDEEVMMQYPDSMASSGNFDDGDDFSRVCGQGVLTKLLGKSPNRSPPRPTPVTSSELSESSPTKSCLLPGKKGLPLYRRRYEDISGGARSPEQDTESSSSYNSSNKSAEEIGGAFVVQFDASQAGANGENEHDDEDEDDSSKSGLLAPYVGYGFRAGPHWSSSLPVVTEESSVDDMSQQSSVHNKDDTSGCPTPSSMSSTASSNKNNKHTSPERNEMLNAMRALVLKQQAALREMVQENAHYRSKLGEYQSLLIKMRQEQVAKDGVINQLTLEREAFEAEAMFLREEIKAIGGGDGNGEDDDTEVQRKLRNLMVDGLSSPGSSMGGSPSPMSYAADRAASAAFKSFKRSLLSPDNGSGGSESAQHRRMGDTSPLGLAVKSLESKYHKQQKQPTTPTTPTARTPTTPTTKMPTTPTARTPTTPTTTRTKSQWEMDEESRDEIDQPIVPKRSIAVSRSSPSSSSAGGGQTTRRDEAPPASTRVPTLTPPPKSRTPPRPKSNSTININSGIKAALSSSSSSRQRTSQTSPGTEKVRSSSSSPALKMNNGGVSFGSGSNSRGSSTAKSAVADEEVNLFKQRLETIQQKRSVRQQQQGRRKSTGGVMMGSSSSVSTGSRSSSTSPVPAVATSYSYKSNSSATKSSGRPTVRFNTAT